MPQARPPVGSLFAIGDDYLALMALFEELEDDPARAEAELDPAMEALFAEIDTAQATKFDGYINFIRALEMREAAAKEEAERYNATAKSAGNRVAFLKLRLMQHLTRTGQAKATTATGRTISVTKNGGATPVVIAEGTDPNAVLPCYQEVKVSINTKAVREALESGLPLDFATLGERGTHLRIK